MLSVIIPTYNEEESIPILVDALLKVLDGEYEIIFVNDGSTDNTTNILSSLAGQHDCIKVIHFQRNFGKSDALNAGFNYCTGDTVITMDADLQDDPKDIPNFIKELNKGFDMVSGWKKDRHDPFSKTIPSKFFNKLTSLLSGVHLHDFNCGFKVYKKNVIKNIDVYGELHRYIPVLASIKGYKCGEITVTHHKRKFGKSKFGFGRLFKGTFDLLTVMFLMRYTKHPLHFFGWVGLMCMISGFLGGCYLVVLKLFGNNIGQRPLLFLVILLMVMAVQFISLGLIAELLIKTKEERYVVREVVNLESHCA